MKQKMESIDRLELLQILKANKKMKTEDEFEKFVDALTELSKIQSSKDLMLPLLLELFDDDTRYLGEMDTILNMIESYSANVDYYVSTIVKQTPYVIESAKKWLEILYLNCIYYNDERSVLQSTLQTLPETINRMILQYIDKLPREAFGEDMSSKFTEILGHS